MKEKRKNLIVGAGITGVTLARCLAEKDEEVLVIEEREHIGGNCFDRFDSQKNYIQEYGPHIFHTNDDEVWEFVSRFTEFNNYSHKVVGYINNKLINIPFNFNSIDNSFEKEKANRIKKALLKEFPERVKIPILELKENNKSEIKELAKYIYENVFLNYTVKQWGLKPNEIDPKVTARVPVLLNTDNNYFQDKYQGIPKKGFTAMMKEMLNHKNIKIILNKKFNFNSCTYDYDKLYYTGQLDEFYNFSEGKIKYRKINLEFEEYNISSYQENSVINYPNDEDFTRITEFNKFLFIENDSTIIIKEYASWDVGFSAYPLQNDENKKMIEKYIKKINKNILFVGRLAECKYYNMDQAIKRGLEIAKR